MNEKQNSKKPTLIEFRYYHHKIYKKFFFSESAETARKEALEYCRLRNFRFTSVTDVMIDMQEELKYLLQLEEKIEGQRETLPIPGEPVE